MVARRTIVVTTIAAAKQTTVKRTEAKREENLEEVFKSLNSTRRCSAM